MIQIYVLSLKSSRDRRAAARSQLEGYGLPFRFFDAPGGEPEDVELLKRHYDSEMNRKYFKRPMSDAEGYCYLGHRGIWHDLANSESEMAMVLEDDFQFDADPSPVVEACSDGIFRNVMIKIDGGHGVEGALAGRIGQAELVRRRVLPARTTGYIIGSDAARALLKSSERFFRPIDLDLKHYWEHQVPIYLLKPALVSEREHGGSLLSKGRKSSKSTSKLTRFWRNLKYQTAFRCGVLMNRSNGASELLLDKSSRAG